MIVTQKHNEYNGIYDIPIDQYHAGPGLSRSDMVKLLDNPYRYYHSKTHQTEFVKTDAMRIGSLVHTLALEPHQFDSHFFEFDDATKRDKRSQTYQDILAEAGKRDDVKSKEVVKAQAMADMLAINPLIRELQNTGYIEQSIYFTVEVIDQYGIRHYVLVKCRPDWMAPPIVIDVKTIDQLSEYKYKNHVIDFGYHIQAALIIDGIKAVTGIDVEHFIDVYVEKTEPHVTQAVKMGENFIAQGRALYQEALQMFVNCTVEQNWQGKYLDFMILDN